MFHVSALEPGLPRTINIQGVEVSGEGLVWLLHSIFQPDPKLTYRFERVGSEVIVRVQRNEVV